MASGGQDGLVKVWDLAPVQEDAGDGEDADAPLRIRPKAFALPCGPAFLYSVNLSGWLSVGGWIEGGRVGVACESVLSGHEGWVQGLRWTADARLLSASVDKSAVLWERDEDGLWLEKVPSKLVFVVFLFLL